MLWNLYQNDLSHHVKHMNLTMYANDHQLYTVGRGRDLNVMKDHLNREATRALTWYDKNYLMANPKKFQLMLIKSRTDIIIRYLSVLSCLVCIIEDYKILLF